MPRFSKIGKRLFRISAETFVRTHLLVVPLIVLALLMAGVLCGSARAQKQEAPGAGKADVRNNAASLLADLLDKDKNVSKILIIKRNSAELGQLIKAISKAASDGEKQLQALAKSDPTLNLHALQLPPGEAAARAADGKTKEHELLSTSGQIFEFNLLFTQAEALGYGLNLARVASENSSSPEQVRAFHDLDTTLSHLYQQVIAKMRTHGGK